MNKNIKITSESGMGKGAKIAIVSLCVLIAALTVLIVLDALGVFYPDEEEIVITPPVRADKTTLKDGDYTYAVLTDGTVMITACALPEETQVIDIPTTLGGYKVSAIGESAFALINDMQNVTVPEGVTYIGSNAFFGALNAKLYLPSTLEQIDKDAMAGFDEPTGIYFAGSEAQWAKVRIADGNAVLSRVICNG